MLKKNKNKSYLSLIFVGIVLMAFMPLPAFVLDSLICFSFSAATILFLWTIVERNPLKMSVYTSLLLYVTILRLGLNIASTRLILSSEPIGSVIPSIGKYFFGGRIGVGIVFLSLLFVINYIVIARGSERIAEVRARFMLESMFSRQMSIDADAMAGRISSKDAEDKKNDILKESDFYSSLEGAFKFIKGDAIAGIVIAFTNLCVGSIFFYLGMIKGGVYSSFTNLSFIMIGDGLVGQIPALLTSVGAGTLIAGANRYSSGGLLNNVCEQLSEHAFLFTIGGCIPIIASLLPGMPVIPFILLGSGLFAIGYFLEDEYKKKETEKNLLSDLSNVTFSIGRYQEKFVNSILKCYEVACSKILKSKGINMPQARFEVDENLPNLGMTIRVFGEEVLSMHDISLDDLAHKVESAVKSKVHERINVTYVNELLSSLKYNTGISVERLLPEKLSYEKLTMILRSLVKEGILLKHLPTIIEMLKEQDHILARPIVDIVEEIRCRLGSSIFSGITNGAFSVHAVTLNSNIEKMIIESEEGLSFSACEKFFTILGEILLKEAVDPVVIVTVASARAKVKSITESKFPNLPVLSYGEIPEAVIVNDFGVITDDILI